MKEEKMISFKELLSSYMLGYDVREVTMKELYAFANFLAANLSNENTSVSIDLSEKAITELLSKNNEMFFVSGNTIYSESANMDIVDSVLVDHKAEDLISLCELAGNFKKLNEANGENA